MKTGRLYVKFFAMFLLILLATEIIIFSFFHFYIEKKRAIHTVYINSYALSSLIENRLLSTDLSPEETQKMLGRMLDDVGRVYNANVWITCQGRFVASSRNAGVRERMQDCLSENARGYIYFASPFRMPDGSQAFLHMSVNKPNKGQMDALFAMGLAGIGILIALMIFPIYRFISKPLSELKSAAMGIAGGDLSTRANIKSSDEIGDLANAFNHMADTIERMVKSTKELTANISHELRSPLARIRVAQELITEKLGDYDKAATYLDSISNEIEEMDKLIGQILFLSKLDLKPVSAFYEKININELVVELINRLNPILEHEKLTVKRDLPQTGALIRGNRDEIRTVLSIIFDNALKYSPAASEISVLVNSSDEKVNITVQNQFGPEFSPEGVKLFDPFSKGRNSKGAGLGLSIAKKIINNHGGTIFNSTEKDVFSLHITMPAV